MKNKIIYGILTICLMISIALNIYLYINSKELHSQTVSNQAEIDELKSSIDLLEKDMHKQADKSFDLLADKEEKIKELEVKLEEANTKVMDLTEKTDEQIQIDEQIQAEEPTLPGNYGTNPDGTPKDLVQYLLEQQQQGLSSGGNTTSGNTTSGTDNSGNSGNSGSNNTGSTGNSGNSGNSGNTGNSGNSGSNNTSNPEDDVTNYNPIAPEEETIGGPGFTDFSGGVHGAGDGTHIGDSH